MNEKPLGFAANHNRILRCATTDYLLVANDDLIFRGHAVSLALAELRRPENRDVGSLSPRLLNEDGTLQRSTYGFPTVSRALLDLSGIRDLLPHNRATDLVARHAGRGYGRSRFWPHDRACDVETFRGAAMFIRNAAWRDSGEFSEVATVRGEIAEWHRRSRDRGWRARYFPAAEVTHYGSRTVGRNRLLQNEYLKGYAVYFARFGKSSALPAFRICGVALSLVRLAAAALSGDRTGVKLWWMNIATLARLEWLKGKQ